MPYKIEVPSLAVQEIVEAFDWYELQREGLGMEFLSDIELFSESLLRNPNAYSFYEEPVRQGRLSRFPYNVIFEVVQYNIVIYSVFMAKQDSNKKGIR